MSHIRLYYVPLMVSCLCKSRFSEIVEFLMVKSECHVKTSVKEEVRIAVSKFQDLKLCIAQRVHTFC